MDFENEEEGAEKPSEPEAATTGATDEVVPTPHDRLFHHVFSNPIHARGELETLSPVGIAQRIDWETLEALPTRVIDPRLAEFRTDVLFRANLGGREVRLYLLLEHQSTADPMMRFRMLTYVVKIWQQYLHENPEVRRLPAVVPMVVHHSARGWTTPTNLRQLVDLDDDSFKTLSAHLPTFEFLLDDLSKHEDHSLRARATTDLARLTLLCLRSLPYSAHPLADLRRWFDLCAAVLGAPYGSDAFYLLARYILATTDPDPTELLAFARELGPKAEELIMTGEQRLIARGKAEGRAEGRAEGKAEVLLKFLGAKFGDLPDSVLTRIKHASLDELDRWVDHLMGAKTLDDVFSD